MPDDPAYILDDAAVAGVLDLPELKELSIDHSPITDATLATHKSLPILRLKNLKASPTQGWRVSQPSSLFARWKSRFAPASPRLASRPSRSNGPTWR